MTDSQVAALLSRTDAAMGLIIALLLEKGLLSRDEVSEALLRAMETVSASPNGPLVSTVFSNLQLVVTTTKLAMH